MVPLTLVDEFVATTESPAAFLKLPIAYPTIDGVMSVKSAFCPAETISAESDMMYVLPDGSTLLMYRFDFRGLAELSELVTVRVYRADWRTERSVPFLA